MLYFSHLFKVAVLFNTLHVQDVPLVTTTAMSAYCQIVIR